MLKRVYLEITNACNLNCPFCSYEKGNNYLSIEQIDDYTSQIKPYCDFIYLHILGEPLLHPNFNETLDILDKKDFKLQLVTNGTLLYKHLDIIKHKCLRKLSISLHSVNKQSFKSYFETIDYIIENNNDLNIELRFYDYNQLDLNLHSYLKTLIYKYGLELSTKKNSYHLKNNVYIYFEELFKWPNINDSILTDIGTCHGAIDMIAINSNSDVTICCLDPKAYNKLGNLSNNSLTDILQSEKYLNYIDDFKKHRIKADLCLRCTYRLRFK